MSVAYVYSHESSKPHTDAVWSMAWTGADQTLSVSADGGLSIFSSPTGDIMQALPAHPVGITAVSTSANGTSALFNSLDGRTSLMDLESRSIVAAAEGGYSAQREPAWTTTLAPDGQTYASTGKSGSATIHSAAPGPSFGEAFARLVSGASPKFGVCCAYSPDGSRLAVGTQVGSVHIFDVGTGTLAATLAPHAMAIRTVAWAPDSHLLITGSEDRRLGLHDVRHAAAGRGAGSVGACAGHAGWVLSADVSPDGRYLLSGSADKTARIWDLGARVAVGAVQGAPGEVWSVRWRPGTTAGAFATGSNDGIVRWYRAAGAE